MLALVVLGACSSPPGSIAGSAIPDEVPHDLAAAAEPAVKFDAAPEEEPETAAPTAAMRLLAISTDGRRALLGVLQPVGRAPELRAVDLATNEVLGRVDLMAIAALPRRGYGAPDFDQQLDKALRDNRLLAEDLASLAPILEGFPRRAAVDYAALDAANIAYVVEHHLVVMRGGAPAAQRIPDATDPWIAPDGDSATLVYNSSGLHAMPFAGGAATKIAGTEHVPPRAPMAVRSATTLRTLEAAPRGACAIDISLTQHRVVHRTCVPPPCAGCAAGAPAMSPAGNWLAWLEADRTSRARIRTMNLATGAVSTGDTVAPDALELAVSDGGRVHAGGDCRFRGDDLVCVRGDRTVVTAGR